MPCCSAIFELAVTQPALDMPEALWKAYIDAEIADGARPAARALYERLLARTQHVKVWLSFAQFEAAPLPLPATGDEAADAAAAEAAAAEAPPEEAPDARAAAARGVYTRAERALAAAGDKEARVMLLEAWRAFEAAAGSRDSLQAVEARLPKRVKRRRALTSADGTPAGMEEYYDYMCAPYSLYSLPLHSMLPILTTPMFFFACSFPEEGGAAPSLKILEAAYRWKQAQAQAQAQAAGEAAGAGAAPADAPGEYEGAEEAEPEEDGGEADE